MMECLFVVTLPKMVTSPCWHSLPGSSSTMTLTERVSEGKRLRAASGQWPVGTEALRLPALKDLSPVNNNWSKLRCRSCPSWTWRWLWPQSVLWLKPCVWGGHPSWFAWEWEVSWNVELLVWKPGKSWANWDVLVTVLVKDWVRRPTEIMR